LAPFAQDAIAAPASQAYVGRIESLGGAPLPTFIYLFIKNDKILELYCSVDELHHHHHHHHHHHRDICNAPITVKK